MSVYLSQRFYNRNNHIMSVMFSRAKDGQFLDIKAVNLSHDGICFESLYPYLKETELFIKFWEKDEISKAKVAWSKPTTEIKRDSNYKIGLHFTEPI